MRLPEFFIVGAPKSGTTFLGERLKDHPRIFLPEWKELHFFGADLSFRTERITRDRYLSLFEGATDHQIAGEASVWYLRSQTAAREIKEFNHGSRIIVMLRNPVDMLYSLHNQMLYTLNEDLEDFREAVEAEEDRRAGRRLPDTVLHPGALDYTAVATYTPQVRRYLNVFGGERVFVGLYDDLQKDPARVLKEIVGFLGQDDSELVARTERVNPRKRPRSRRLQRFLINPPSWVSVVGRTFLNQDQRRRLAATIERRNRRTIESRPLDQATRRWLGPRFEGDIAELSSLIGRDLSAWTESWR